MDSHRALQFLRKYQPLPDDNKLTEALIGEYDDIREYLMDHPNPESIPLLLNSFGDGYGSGVYQLVENVFSAFSPDMVIPHLIKALSSSYVGVRYWNAQISELYPSPLLLEPLGKLLMSDPISDVRYAAATALSKMSYGKALDLLRIASKSETDEEVLEFINTTLSEYS